MRRFGLAAALLLVAAVGLGQVAVPNNDPRQYPEASPGVVRSFTRPAPPSTPPCTEVNVPFIVGQSAIYVGYEYPFPVLTLFANTPTHRNPTGIGAGPDFVIGNAYLVNGPIDYTSVIQPYDVDDVGVQFIVEWANNCFGIGLNGAAMTQVAVLETLWSAGEPRLVLVPGYVEIPGPVTAVTMNFASLFAWQEDTVSVVITDSNTAATVYSGAYGPSMVNNATYTCAYTATWGTNVYVSVAATNATGTMETTGYFQIQDPFAHCGGPG